MGKILIICYVAAGFGPYDGQMFFVKPEQRGVFIEAPEWISQTIMFKGLVADGSLKVADEHISKKQGENDPMKGITAEGKEEKPEPEKLIKTRKKPAEKK